MGSNLKEKEYGFVMSSKADEDDLELLVKGSWRKTLQKYFHETMRTPSSVTAYIDKPCVRTDLQVILAWSLVRIRDRSMKSPSTPKRGSNNWN